MEGLLEAAALRVNISFFINKHLFGNYLGKSKVLVTPPEGGYTFYCHLLLKYEIVFLSRVLYIIWLIILGGRKWYIQCQRMGAICNLPLVIINTHRDGIWTCQYRPGNYICSGKEWIFSIRHAFNLNDFESESLEKEEECHD